MKKKTVAILRQLDFRVVRQNIEIISPKRSFPSFVVKTPLAVISFTVSMTS